MTALRSLFSPVRIGSMELKNRIVMSTISTGDYCNRDGTVSEKLIGYLEARARGGVGLINTEPVTIGEKLPYTPRTLGIWDDRFIPGLRRLTDALHSHGAKVQPQLMHPGPESLSPFFHKTPAKGPSAVICHTTKQICHEMTRDEIAEAVKLFGEGARRVREAGFDGVELHAAHSYMLVGSFLSPLRNRRTDEYGGSIEGRLRLLLEVIDSIKQSAGSDFPLTLRISGDELMPGGNTIDDMQHIAPILVEAGVHAFHVSAGAFPNWRIIAPTGTPYGLNVSFAAALKEVVDVPVMTVGRINDPRLAETILRRKQADLIVMGRALLADPELPLKAMEGRFDDIAPCISCLLGCRGVTPGMAMTCVVNPALGREREMTITPATQPGKVMVVGAGPGGLETARVAALRGHQVDIYEKDRRIGGQFNLAAVPPMKQELVKVLRYLSIQAEKAGANIRLNTEVTPEIIAEANPDVLVVATGGVPLIPDIPGSDGENVITAHDVLAGRLAIHGADVLVIGGGMVGCETAEFLANRGDNPLIGRTRVTIVEMLDDVAKDLAPENRSLLMQNLREAGVTIITSARVKGILEDGVVIEQDGEESSIRPLDYIVLAMGVKSYNPFGNEIMEKVRKVHVIGDAANPCRALEAIADGARVGREI